MGSIGTGLKVCVFTTSYPRSEDDFAGRFVSDAVAHLENAGVAVDVVKPGVYRDFGLAFDGGGIMSNIRRKPWLAPLLFLSMVVALRRAARSADLVHAHWLAGAVVAMFAGKPFVVTIHGSISGGFLDDFRLCERHPRIVRFVLSRARAVLCVSEALTEAVCSTGVATARFVPNGIAIPGRVCREDDSLEVFYTGRLSPEKGIKELAEATAGMNLVVTGDGPLRDLVPTRGFVSRDELERCYERAAVVVCPSLSEGFGVVCAEAMAHGKPVVASAVGGLANLIEDGRTGLLVPAGDVNALRSAIERLLSDGELRQHLGAAARERIASFYGWKRVTEATLAAYQETVDSPRAITRTGSAGRLAGIIH